MIRADDLHKKFAKVEALKGVSFAAADGRITGLLGPNGAGKSTTLRILYTVLKPNAGTAYIDDCNVLDDPLQARRNIGVLPHGAGLYRHLTARENVRYFGQLTGITGDILDQRVSQLIERLDMKEFADRKAGGFSQGQRTKVALARALIHEPRNLLLDEPSNGLDVMATRALRELVVRLKAEGKCILFSSHVMQEVAALCDDIVIIGKGRVVMSGTPDAIREKTGYENLEDAFVNAIGSAEGLE